ncbi:MAG TPA: monooxygenase, partial [Micromonosporaceae bacterium]
GQGRWFGPTRADPTRWAALVVADQPGGLDRSGVAGSWQRLAVSSCHLALAPISSRGSWAGHEPFRTGWAPAADWPDPTVLALTRARLRLRRAVRFWRAIAPVGAAATAAPGLLATFGIGEAPIGWQGTVSVWRSRQNLVEFAYRHPEHRSAIERTPAQGWYAEELFARFAVLDVTGDRSLIGWAEEGTA